MSCGKCVGSGRGSFGGSAAECPTCKGSGRRYLQRCASVYMEPWMLEFFEAIALLEVGIMPNDGGWMEQTWDFVSFRRAVLQQRAECANEKSDSQQAIKEAKRGKR